MPLTAKELKQAKEGVLTVDIYTQGDLIILDFDEDISWMALTARQAKEVADILRNYAAQVQDIPVLDVKN